MESIGMRLKKIREKENLNQRDFAKRVGISQGMLSGIEKGTEKFSRRTQRIVCLEFGIEENWLLAGQGPMLTPSKPPPEPIQGPDGRELTPEELELVGTYDKLIPETQKEVLKYANDRLELQELREKAGEASGGVTRPLEAPQEAKPEESTGIGPSPEKDGKTG
jgi:transcriptional regulator with XRE-family HTH domain